MNRDNKEKTILSDNEIVELYWERNEVAIQATDTKYGKYLNTIAYNIVHDSLDCEECLNDTYLGTWNAIPPTRPNVLRVFLAKIMRGVAINKYRERSAKKRIPSELIVSLVELDESITYDFAAENEALIIEEISRVLNDFLRELPEREEFVFVCRYYYSDYISTIAKMLDVSENTVYRELAEIRKNLKERLEKEGIRYE